MVHLVGNLTKPLIHGSVMSCLFSIIKVSTIYVLFFSLLFKVPFLIIQSIYRDTFYLNDEIYGIFIQSVYDFLILVPTLAFVALSLRYFRRKKTPRPMWRQRVMESLLSSFFATIGFYMMLSISYNYNINFEYIFMFFVAISITYYLIIRLLHN